MFFSLLPLQMHARAPRFPYALHCTGPPRPQGSILVDVSSPESAEAVASRCEAMLGESGQSPHATGQGAAQSLWGEASASYRGATPREILTLASDRARKLKFSQMALVIGLLFLLALFLPSMLLAGICVFNAAE
jgi:hypothetical protein